VNVGKGLAARMLPGLPLRATARNFKFMLLMLYTLHSEMIQQALPCWR
jgi:hypothetical protein